MPKWEFNAPVTGSITVEIVADTEEEARRLLADGEYEPSVDLCIQCSGYTSHVNKFPVRFDLTLDAFETPEFDDFQLTDD